MPAPSRLLHHRLVVGFHGCEREVGERVLLGRGTLKPSTNNHDWLGSGIYFWEHSERRALQWALEKRFRDPFVLGAYVNLGRCFDLTDTESTDHLAEFYEDYVRTMRELDMPLSENRPGRAGGADLLVRRLDCDVLNAGLAGMDTLQGGSAYFQTVRGVFVEGQPAYPGAGIHTKTHVQFAVRDPRCILGYFMPAGYDHSQEAAP